MKEEMEAVRSWLILDAVKAAGGEDHLRKEGGIEGKRTEKDEDERKGTEEERDGR